MSENKAIKQRAACQWCGKPNVLINNLVCNDCYVLLVRAGVKEEEIFKETAKKTPFSDNSPEK